MASFPYWKKNTPLLLSCLTVFPHMNLHDVYKKNILKDTVDWLTVSFCYELNFLFWSITKKQEVLRCFTHCTLSWSGWNHKYSRLTWSWSSSCLHPLRFTVQVKTPNVSPCVQPVLLSTMLLDIPIDKQTIKSKWLQKIFFEQIFAWLKWDW